MNEGVLLQRAEYKEVVQLGHSERERERKGKREGIRSITLETTDSKIITCR